MLESRLSPPVSSFTLASRKGVVSLPWMPLALAWANASLMAALITAGSMEYSSGMGLATSIPPSKPSSRLARKAAASSSGVSTR